MFDSNRGGQRFDEPTKALIYSRFANPTVMAVENHCRFGAAWPVASSGQAATLIAVLNPAKRATAL